MSNITKKAVVKTSFGIFITFFVLVFATHSAMSGTNTKLTTEYQAVLLSNGQAYFGKLEGVGSPYPVLKDVF